MKSRSDRPSASRGCTKSVIRSVTSMCCASRCSSSGSSCRSASCAAGRRVGSARAGAAVPLGRADPLQAQHAVAAAPRPGEDGQAARQRTGSVAACIGAQRVACACSQLSPRMLADASAARRLRRASSCVERAWVSAAAARLALTCGESLPAGAASPEASRWQQQRLPDKHSAQPGGSGRPHRVLPPPVLEELGRGSRGEDAHAHSVCERLYPVHALACARSCTAKRRSTYSPEERRWEQSKHQPPACVRPCLCTLACCCGNAKGRGRLCIQVG